MTPLGLFRDRLLSRLSLAQRQSEGGWPLPNLADDQIAQMAQYFDLLRRWNRVINLTALPLDTLEDQTIDRLFVEPLSAVTLLDRPALGWADLGSGGGSPAVPLRIVAPSVVLTMVESKGRKAAFLREVVRALGLQNIAVVDRRAEAVSPAEKGQFDLITIRAVRIDTALLEAARHMLKNNGRMLVFAAAASSSPWVLGFEVVEKVPLPNSSGSIVVLRAV
ncbi:MAG: 16S rRNA (guanine(527)-N(7))-methyltransferase RsmG [Luteitalea sp.]|nr:16S rRNA (guanine(527)-N(7))-methyltransferase RsmG [Luteitalea sp.]